MALPVPSWAADTRCHVPAWHRVAFRRLRHSARQLLKLPAVILRNVPSTNREVRPTTAAAMTLPAPLLCAVLLPSPCRWPRTLRSRAHSSSSLLPALQNRVLPAGLQGRDLPTPGSFRAPGVSSDINQPAQRSAGGRLRRCGSDGPTSEAGEEFAEAPSPSPPGAQAPSSARRSPEGPAQLCRRHKPTSECSRSCVNFTTLYDDIGFRTGSSPVPCQALRSPASDLESSYQPKSGRSTAVVMCH